jgi:sterol 3beta-glucosyltransferase
MTGEDPEEEDEESWTFVGADEPDPDFVTKKLSEGFVGLGAGAGAVAPLGGNGSRALGSQVLRGP